MNILLINPPQRTGSHQPPMGLALLAAVLERAGHKVKIGDVGTQWLDAIQDADVVGITAVTPTITAAWQLAKDVKARNPRAKIILGGQHASLLPEESLNAAPFDVVVTGEGEKTILDAINGAHGIMPGERIRQMDNLPYLAYHLLDWGQYSYMAPHGKYRPTLPMQTSRGCPYSCAFCSKPVFGKDYRAMSPWRVLSEIRDVVNAYGVREIAFYDDVFTMDKKRTHEICEGLLKQGIKIHWTCETRVNLVDLDLLQHMKQAGCMAIAYGIESGSPRIRMQLNKGITGAQIETAVSWTQKAGIETIGYFMVGTPGETADDVQATIDFAVDLGLDYAQFSQTMAYPGTALYESLPEKPKTWDELTYTGNGHHTAHQAYKAFYQRPGYVWQRIKSMHSIPDLVQNLRGVGVLVRGKV